MSDTLKSLLWISQGMHYEFPETTIPEIASKPMIGACFSGGGTRAMTAAMGQLRAMNHLGVIPTLRYISCVSGGSWASTIYTYYRSGASNDDELLGPITRAKDISEQHVNTGLTKSQLAYGATKSLEDIVASWEFDIEGNYSSHDVWNYSVGQAYLSDFGLFDVNQATYHPDRLDYFTYSDSTEADIKHCNPSLAHRNFIKPRPERPFLIVNSCVLLPQDDPSQADLINFEYTALTVGRPYLTDFQGTKYGGGYIEPFAYRSHAPSSGPVTDCCKNPPPVRNSSGWVDVPAPKRHYSLTETTGTSSSAFAKEIIKKYDVTRFTPQDFYWAVNGDGPYSGAETLFGDGGLLENNGIIPLIQRGVWLAIVFVNTQTKLDPTYSPTLDKHDVANDPDGRCDVYVPSLFGYSNPNWKWTYPNNQIFPTSDFKTVLDKLNEKRRRNQPMIVNCRHSVVENSSWGVRARPEKMWVTWCYLDRCKGWESNLGSDTVRNQIEAGNASKPTGPYQHFPNYLTMWQNGDNLVKLSREQVTLLADFTCDSILIDDENSLMTAIRAVTDKAE